MIRAEQTRDKRAERSRRPARNLRATVAKTVRRPQFQFGAVFLVPTLVWYLTFSIFPILRSAWISVVNYQMLNPAASRFVGLGNFRQLVQDPQFGVAVRNTLTWAVLAFALMLPLSMLLSLCLVNVKRGRTVYQAVIFIPVVVSLVAVALLFRILMDPEIGLFNRILEAVGLPRLRWLSSSASALPVAVAIGVWKAMGVYVVILTAGMLNIPSEMYDAALVDGANRRQMFWRITLPLLGHTLALVTVLLTIGSLQEFTLPHVLTQGGPGSATYLWNMLIYDEAFQNARFGIATAAAVVQFALILGISLLQLRLLRPSWSY